MNLYYISFATDTEFLGATVVEGVSEAQAYEIATNNDLNPGGQAAIICIPDGMEEHSEVVPFKYKLLSKNDIDQLGQKFIRHGDMDEQLQYIMEINAVVK